MSERQVRVMVTAVGGGSHGEQILKALKLAERPYFIVGADMTPYSSGLAHVDEPLLLPPASDPGYLDALLEACREHEVEVLFHGSEPELKLLSREREAIAEAGILLPINRAEVIDACLNKVATMETLAKEGLTVPVYARVTTLADAVAFETLPAVLKPSIGGGGSANLYLVQSAEELEACSRQLLEIHDEFIIQEYVGTPEDEYTVGVLSDLDGNFVNSIAIRRQILSALSNRIKVPNRTGRSELGEVLAISSGVSQGEVVDVPEVTGPCEQIAAALGSAGPLNIQCRLGGGELYPFEINPRFSGTTSLRAMVGFNEPDILVRRHLLDEEVEERFAYDHAVIVRSLAETLISDADFRRYSGRG